MPDVTISTDFGEKIELKSAPPDGYIHIRPLPYGMKLERRDKATRMSMEQQARRRGGGRRDNEEDTAKVDIEFLSKWTRNFEFKYCIGEHNLTDANGTLLDFSHPFTLDVLDPRVGDEIGRLLDEINGDEDEETLEDFTKRASASSPDETPQDSATT